MSSQVLSILSSILDTQKGTNIFYHTEELGEKIRLRVVFALDSKLYRMEQVIYGYGDVTPQDVLYDRIDLKAKGSMERLLRRSSFGREKYQNISNAQLSDIYYSLLIEKGFVPVKSQVHE